MCDRENESVNHLLSLTNIFSLQENEKYEWRWRLSPDGRYKTRNAYDVLVSLDNASRRAQTVEKGLI